MANLRELVTVFGFEPDEAGLDNIENVIGGLKTGFIAVAAAAAASAGVMFGIASSVASFGDNAVKTAQRIGLTAESLQRLDFAMQISGTSMEQQRGAMVKLARGARDADEGIAAYADAYAALGVEVRDANGDFKGTEDLLLDLATAFQGMPDGIEKTALAAEIFGRSGTSMLQFLNEGREGITALGDEAEALGGILSNEAADDAAVFQDTITRLKLALNGLKLALGSELIPVIADLIQKMLDYVLVNKELLGARISEFFTNLAKFVGAVGKVMFSLIKTTGLVVAALGGLQQILDGLIFAFTVLAVHVIRTLLIPAIISFISSVSIAGIVTMAAGAATWLWNAALAAIPLAITAIIVLVIAMIDDFRRFMNGQDSLLGRLVDKYAEVEGGIGGMFASILRGFRDIRDHGEMALQLMLNGMEFTLDRMTGAWERMGLRVQLILATMMEGARDAMDVLSIIPGIEGRSSAEEEASEFTRDRIQGELGRNQREARDRVANRTNDRILFGEQLATRQAERRASAAVDASTVMQVEVNVNGGDPDAVREQVQTAITAADEQRRRELFRSLGNLSPFAGEAG